MPPTERLHDKPLAAIHCIGPFAAFNEAGQPLVFQTQRAKAIIAMLALSPRGTRSRAWLRDKLWSDRDEQQGSASLRQSLFEIRRALGPRHAEILVADKHSVRLELTGVLVDRSRYAAEPQLLGALLDGREGGLEFLEGIDIADPEFEEWLTIERSAFADLLERAARAPVEPPKPSQVPAQPAETPKSQTEPQSAPRVERLAIGLLPSVTTGLGGSDAGFADLLAEIIAANLSEIQPLDIYDLRDTGRVVADLPPGLGPDWLLRLRIAPLGSAVNLTLLVYRTSDTRLVWSNSASGADGEAARLDSSFVGNFLAQCVDRLARTLFDTPFDPSPADLAARANYKALNLMFRLDLSSLDEAERLLDETSRNDPKATSLSLLSYISSIRLGDGLGAYGEAHRQATRRQARQALDADPYNSVSLSCLGHVSGFVLRDFEAAGDALTRAIALNPHQAFAWDHFALLNLYMGRLDEARAASRTAVMLGSYSPLRFAFETTLAMVSAIAGDHRAAIFYGERALSRQPLFKPAKRYLLAAHVSAGNVSRSVDLLAELRKEDPALSLAQLRRHALALTKDDHLNHVLSAFRQAGLR